MNSIKAGEPIPDSYTTRHHPTEEELAEARDRKEDAADERFHQRFEERRR